MTEEPEVLARHLKEIYGESPNSHTWFERRDDIKALQDQLMGMFCIKYDLKPSKAIRAAGHYFFKNKPNHYGICAWPQRLFDHIFTFKERGNHNHHVIVSHPYDVDDGKKHDAVEFAKRYGWSATFPDFPSWWYPGRTSLILWRKEFL